MCHLTDPHRSIGQYLMEARKLSGAVGNTIPQLVDQRCQSPDGTESNHLAGEQPERCFVAGLRYEHWVQSYDYDFCA